jgi:hypothetical protein
MSELIERARQYAYIVTPSLMYELVRPTPLEYRIIMYNSYTVDRKEANQCLLNCESRDLNLRPLLRYHVKFMH